MNKEFSLSGFSSLAVHAGHKTESNYAHQVPIYASSTYVYDTAEQGMRRFSGKEEGYIYSRWGNPTISEAEEKIAALETFGLVNKNGEALKVKGILHASGMAAITTMMLATLKTGDKILTHFSLYGGTDEFVHKVLPQFGITAIITDLRDLNKAKDIIKSDPAIRMIYLETPANPTIQCVDIEELTRLAKQKNLVVACDNTFATPYLQQPFKYDVDFVMHSTTKFLKRTWYRNWWNIIRPRSRTNENACTKTHRLLGGNANPFDAFLLIQGIKTLELRMDRHCYNAMEVANFLEHHAAVARVNYTGLSSHPDNKTAMKQMKHPGGMLSFELKKGLQGGIDFMNKLKMCVRTVSLGTCDTLLSHPASMSHHGVPKEMRERYGITDGLIRMNVGIENLQDIIADLDQSLQ